MQTWVQKWVDSPEVDPEVDLEAFPGLGQREEDPGIRRREYPEVEPEAVPG